MVSSCIIGNLNLNIIKDDYGTIALNYIHNDIKKPIKVIFVSYY